MIYLTRHGQTDWNVKKWFQGHTDIPLNEQGRGQARALAEAIKQSSNQAIKQVYTSPLLRAHETATIVCEHALTHLTPIPDDRIMEYMLGDLEGKHVTHFTTAEQWADFNINPKKYNAESYQELFNRIKDFMDSLPQNENILIVSHNGSLKMMLYYAKHKTFNLDEFLKNFLTIHLENAALIKWE